MPINVEIKSAMIIVKKKSFINILYLGFIFDLYLKGWLCIINNMAGGVGEFYSDFYDDYENINFNTVGGLLMGITFVCLIMNSIV